MNRKRRITWRIAIGIAVFSAIVSSALAATTVGPLKGGKAAAAGAAKDWSLREAAAPYQGTTLRVLEEHNGDLENFFDLYKEFEKETGIKIQVSIEAHPDVLRKSETDLYTGTGQWDLLLIHAFQMPGLVAAKTLEPIGKYYGNPKLRDPSVKFENFLQPAQNAVSSWGGRNYCLNRWNYTNIWWGLRNLFENPAEKVAFKQKYGYPLARPKTLQQVRDIAEFFGRPKGAKAAGKTLSRPLYGIVFEGSRVGLVGNEFWFNWLNQFGSLFDKAGRPTANSAANKEALDLYASLWKLAPPNEAELTFFDIPVVAGNGIAAQGFGQVEVFYGIDRPGGSKNAGNFIYTGIPANAKSPRKRSVQGVPTCDVLNAKSKNKEAAYLFMQWTAAPKTQQLWRDLKGPFLPILKADFRSPRIKERSDFFRAFADSQKHVVQYPPLPSFLKFLDVINLRTQEAGLGKKTASAALDALQSDLTKICKGGSCFAKF